MTFKDWVVKLTSRKFLMAIGGLITVVAVALGRADLGNVIANALVEVGLAVGAVLIALGYIVAEASIDKQAIRETELTERTAIHDA